MSDPTADARPTRQPWADRWLLDAFRQLGNPLAEHLTPAPSAWEALEVAGIPTETIVRLVCELSGAREADLSALGPEHAELLSSTLSRRYDVIGVRLTGRTLEVATANPLGHNLERDLAFACARSIRVTVASPSAIRQTRERIYQEGTASSQSTRLSWVVAQSPTGPVAAPTRGVAVDTLDRLVIDAIDQRASDIHLEPQDGELVVRYRVDGVLHDVMRIPADVTPLMLSRLKVSAGLDIANRLRPQDGRASMILDGRPIDLRISTLPLGDRLEKAVIRILDASATTLDFSSLGFTEAEQHRLDKVLQSNEGMVLVTGPTGSGKTTTLYAALRHVKSRETNIVTVEDPVEYRLEGVNQVQVHEKAGLTFASALRSILRQDPDVVLVGEIRDVETALIAIRASMTGHLVLSTLHTNDAASAVGRLADMGVDLSALAGALKAVIAQRLVRKLCAECSVPARVSDLPPEMQVYLEGRDTTQLRQPVGCAACRGTGYRGRMAVAEMLVIDDETQQVIARSTRRLELMQLARKNGMHTLWETGLDRVINGLTSLQELVSNVTPPIPEGDLVQEDVDRLMNELMGGPAASVEAEPSVDAAPDLRPILHDPPAPPTPTRSTMGSSGGGRAPRLVIAPRSLGNGQPRVLVAHDNREVRSNVRKALERAGCTVIEVADGEAALSYACRLRPDAVVTEIALPKLDGIGLVQVLVTEEIVDRVFVYTAQHDEPLLAWARELGACDVLTTVEEVETLATRVRAEFPGGSGALKLRAS
jgi:type II secretory ATPase GspE/PulE/Tfp pilus assembly ATPase PilB-like protein